MACNVKSERRVEIHQALHGYSDGHRQLAISTKLEPSDTKLLLTFSDISGAGAKPDSDGYLTGYPLFKSGFFALSRTWLALNMPRPGCVWTHTLLVRFADLAVIETLEELNDCFTYPEHRGQFVKFNSPMEYVFTNSANRSIQITEVEALVLRELYGRPTRRLCIERPDSNSDELVFALWSQQWPRLRRSFSFCSLCTRDRSSSGINFDLQMFPVSLGNIAGLITHSPDDHSRVSTHDDWVVRALRDLERPNGENLRSFLKLIGSDVEGGREAFKPMCTLFAALKEKNDGLASLGRALTTLESEPSLSSARTARKAVANAATRNIDRIDDVELSFLWKNIEFVSGELLSKHGPVVVQTLWRKKPEDIDKLDVHNATQRRLIKNTVKSIELSELIGHITGIPGLQESALQLRPELMQEVSFWKNATELEKSVEAAATSAHRKECLVAMILAERNELPNLAVRNLGERDILSVVVSLINRNEDVGDLQTWTKAATRNPVGITEIMLESKELNLTFLTMVARCLSEESIPNFKGRDPWLIALKHAEVEDKEKPIDLRLSVFLLNRALGGESRSPGGLVRVGFESVDRAVVERRLPEVLWRKLEKHLPQSIFWFYWSRSHRLRTAVAGLFVDRRLPVEEFIQVTTDIDVFGDLSRQMSWSRSGRNYLKKVMQALKSEEKQSNKKSEELDKSRIIKKLLR